MQPINQDERFLKRKLYTKVV